MLIDRSYIQKCCLFWNWLCGDFQYNETITKLKNYRVKKKSKLITQKHHMVNYYAADMKQFVVTTSLLVLGSVLKKTGHEGGLMTSSYINLPGKFIKRTCKIKYSFWG